MVSTPLIIPYTKRKKHAEAIATATTFYVELNPDDACYTPFIYEYEDAFNWIRQHVGVRENRITIQQTEHPLPESRGAHVIRVFVHRGM